MNFTVSIKFFKMRSITLLTNTIDDVNYQQELRSQVSLASNFEFLLSRFKESQVSVLMIFGAVFSAEIQNLKL